MFDCAYCERPLACDGCGTPYRPSSREEYEALSRGDVPVTCPACGGVLVCHWCKMPYDGLDAADRAPGGSGPGPDWE